MASAHWRDQCWGSRNCVVDTSLLWVVHTLIQKTKKGKVATWRYTRFPGWGRWGRSFMERRAGGLEQVSKLKKNCRHLEGHTGESGRWHKSRRHEEPKRHWRWALLNSGHGNTGDRHQEEPNHCQDFISWKGDSEWLPPGDEYASKKEKKTRGQSPLWTLCEWKRAIKCGRGRWTQLEGRVEGLDTWAQVLEPKLQIAEAMNRQRSEMSEWSTSSWGCGHCQRVAESERH